MQKNNFTFLQNIFVPRVPGLKLSLIQNFSGGDFKAGINVALLAIPPGYGLCLVGRTSYTLWPFGLCHRRLVRWHFWRWKIYHPWSYECHSRSFIWGVCRCWSHRTKRIGHKFWHAAPPHHSSHSGLLLVIASMFPYFLYRSVCFQNRNYRIHHGGGLFDCGQSGAPCFGHFHN